MLNLGADPNGKQASGISVWETYFTFLIERGPVVESVQDMDIIEMFLLPGADPNIYEDRLSASLNSAGFSEDITRLEELRK